MPLLGRWGSVGLATAALAYNAIIAPRLGWDRSYRRAGEGFRSGLSTYPLAVLLACLLFPLDVAAGAWVVLAALDPVAAAVGSSVSGPRVPGNPRKSLVGTAAGFLVAAACCYGILRYMGRAEPLPAAVAAAGAGAVAEALPLPEDNLAITAAAGLVLWGLL